MPLAWDVRNKPARAFKNSLLQLKMGDRNPVLLISRLYAEYMVRVAPGIELDELWNSLNLPLIRVLDVQTDIGRME